MCLVYLVSHDFCGHFCKYIHLLSCDAGWDLEEENCRDGKVDIVSEIPSPGCAFCPECYRIEEDFIRLIHVRQLNRVLDSANDFDWPKEKLYEKVHILEDRLEEKLKEFREECGVWGDG
ncbi:hypothetical protein MMC20_007562 [Loxospora ochrophaea]|nr:hypothetical protein [Loxospora ochrophaea]